MKTYLGDSVYAEWENGEIALTTGIHPGPLYNIIILEPEVIAAFETFLSRVKIAIQEEEKPQVPCQLCGQDTPSETAHLLGRRWVGECCWDGRLCGGE